MTPLATEVLRILESEVNYPPMTADSLVNVLKATGYPHGPAGLPEVVTALEQLMLAGMVERVHSARLGPRYRMLRSRQAGNVA